MSRGAHGLRAWIVQRATAVYLAGFFLYLAYRLLVAPPAGYAEWRRWTAEPAVVTGFALFYAALLLHAWVGLRDVIMDYVKPAGVRVALLAALAGALLSCAFWALRVLLGVTA